MHKADHCLICQGNSLERHRAIFSPFIARRIWDRPPFPIQVLHCRRCGFSFADTRFDPAEEAKLYRDYRGEEYWRSRNRCEPWYTKQFNRNMSSPETMAKRRAPIASIFHRHVPPDIKTVLDFGGDTGELFADVIPGSSTFVYDISGIEPAPGVKAIRSLEECRQRPFDLVACSNVLEHVASPGALLADMAGIASPNTLLFLEVPAESPSGLATLAKRCAQQALLIGARPRIALRLFPLHFIHQVHEHVNFFSLDSLAKLLQAAGLEVMAKGKYPSEGFSFGPYKLAAGKMAWALARRQGSNGRADLKEMGKCAKT